MFHNIKLWWGSRKQKEDWRHANNKHTSSARSELSSTCYLTFWEELLPQADVWCLLIYTGCRIRIIQFIQHRVQANRPCKSWADLYKWCVISKNVTAPSWKTLAHLVPGLALLNWNSLLVPAEHSQSSTFRDLAATRLICVRVLMQSLLGGVRGGGWGVGRCVLNKSVSFTSTICFFVLLFFFLEMCLK